MNRKEWEKKKWGKCRNKWVNRSEMKFPKKKKGKVANSKYVSRRNGGKLILNLSQLARKYSALTKPPRSFGKVRQLRQLETILTTSAKSALRYGPRFNLTKHVTNRYLPFSSPSKNALIFDLPKLFFFFPRRLTWGPSTYSAVLVSLMDCFQSCSVPINLSFLHLRPKLHLRIFPKIFPSHKY